MRDVFVKRSNGLFDRNIDHLIVNDMPCRETDEEVEEDENVAHYVEPDLKEAIEERGIDMVKF